MNNLMEGIDKAISGMNKMSHQPLDERKAKPIDRKIKVGSLFVAAFETKSGQDVKFFQLVEMDGDVGYFREISAKKKFDKDENRDGDMEDVLYSGTIKPHINKFVGKKFKKRILFNRIQIHSLGSSGTDAKLWDGKQQRWTDFDKI